MYNILYIYILYSIRIVQSIDKTSIRFQSQVKSCTDTEDARSIRIKKIIIEDRLYT